MSNLTPQGKAVKTLPTVNPLADKLRKLILAGSRFGKSHPGANFRKGGFFQSLENTYEP